MIPTLSGFIMGLSAPDAPIMNHHTSTGQFIITNYNSSLVYTATLVTGSGTATLNTGTGVFTLSSANARFSVTAGYASTAPQSSADFMERKSYIYTNDPICSDNCASAYNYPDPNNNCYQQGHPNCCNSSNSCWGSGVDGNCAADGTICCGGSRGQTCNNNYVKNATPSGYTDSYGEWWRVS